MSTTASRTAKKKHAEQRIGYRHACQVRDMLTARDAFDTRLDLRERGLSA